MQDFKAQYAVPPLHTTSSFSKLVSKAPDTWDRRWPRHMSWTAMVDVLAAAVPSDMTDSDNIATRTNADCALAFENTLAMEGRGAGQRLEALKTRETAWVEEKVRQIEAYDEQASRDQTYADLVYHQKYDEYNALHNASDDLLTEERANLTEAIKDVETLGAKLEYELSALESKVEDVENGVAEFERQVTQIEMRAGELDSEKEATVTWTGWILRKVGMV
ncbi:hypothetical protein ABVK25_003046 [Lepraria finkii]|uniref:Uncharacterized protein n=1 Tax=Lepraria finkii TaxID=1340010 RepID=A0ABR4BFN8_9LECA